ncbi:MAG: signal peptidase II [Oscillospiraceae bacterium]|nr:signal peptidase II [Oscillospiraceae bacterium]
MSGALMAAVAAAIVAFDQWSKFWTVTHLELGESIPFLPPILALHRVHNYGAAWSSFSGARWFLIIVTAVGMLALAYLGRRIVHHPLGRWPLAAVIGGGVGNLIDRVRLGYVVDMLDAVFIDFPVFNVADCFVVCGTIVLCIYYLFYYEKYDAGNWEKKDGSDPADRG